MDATTFSELNTRISAHLQREYDSLEKWAASDKANPQAIAMKQRSLDQMADYVNEAERVVAHLQQLLRDKATQAPLHIDTREYTPAEEYDRCFRRLKYRMTGEMPLMDIEKERLRLRTLQQQASDENYGLINCPAWGDTFKI